MRQGEARRTLRTSRLPKQEANATKVTIHTLDARIKHYQWILNVWRSFGDGITFIYLDKWAVKPLLYNTNNSEFKKSAGSILGKSGLKNELLILLGILSKGVPALLADITNCIRHGDICLLHCSDPILVEVKSSKNTSARIDRQIESIKSIHDYHATDEAKNIRGMDLVNRVALSTSEVHYRHLFDEGIATALAKGFFKVDPEPDFVFLH